MRTVDELDDVERSGEVSACSSLGIADGVVDGLVVQEERDDVCPTEGCSQVEWTGISVHSIGRYGAVRKEQLDGGCCGDGEQAGLDDDDDGPGAQRTARWRVAAAVSRRCSPRCLAMSARKGRMGAGSPGSVNGLSIAVPWPLTALQGSKEPDLVHRLHQHALAQPRNLCFILITCLFY